MEKGVRFFYYSILNIGMYGSGLGFLYCLFLYFGFNGFGDIFEYRSVDDFSYTTRIDKSGGKSYMIIDYNYIANGKSYNSRYEVPNSNLDSIEILYNTSLPSLSILKGTLNDGYKQRYNLWFIRQMRSFSHALLRF